MRRSKLPQISQGIVLRLYFVCNLSSKVKCDTGITDEFRYKLLSILNWDIHGDFESLCYEVDPYALYPNPAHNYLIIEGLKGSEDIRLLDINSRHVDSFVATRNKAILDISHIPSGLYFLRIIFEYNEVHYEKVIIH